MKLTTEMQRMISVLKEHGILIRYAKGLWNIQDCELEERYGNITGRSYFVPIHPLYTELNYFTDGTVKALLKRGIISAKVNGLYCYPYEIFLN